MDYSKFTENEMLCWLKDNLTDVRFKHSLSTAQCARDLAVNYQLDGTKAYLAGLLHDCAKCMSYEKSKEIIDAHLTLEEEEVNNIKIIHAPVGAYLAEKVLGITDYDILSAIRWHTLGKVDMSDFDKVIYIADKIEPETREDVYTKPIKAALNKGLNNAMLQCFKQTLKGLIDRNLVICKTTIDLYNQLLK